MAFRGADLPPAFRFAYYATHELLDLVVAERAAAKRAVAEKSRFDWAASCKKLAQLAGIAGHYFGPVQRALTTTKSRPVCCGFVEPTAFQAVLRLAHETTRAWDVFHMLTQQGTQPLRIPQKQRGGLAPSLKALRAVPSRTAGRLVSWMEIEAAQGALAARESEFLRPETVAKEVFSEDLAKEYLIKIGAEPTPRGTKKGGKGPRSPSATKSAPPGTPGRPADTVHIAKFANTRRKRQKPKPWTEIYVEWKFENPKDERVKGPETIREAWRRHFGDRAKVKKKPKG
jgi:hypothetical protein